MGPHGPRGGIVWDEVGMTWAVGQNFARTNHFLREIVDKSVGKTLYCRGDDRDDASLMGWV
jgi:hypothetical protein